MRYAAILLSRQSLRPTGLTPWVRQSVSAARWIKDTGLGLVSSLGMQTWELITALASDLKIPLRLVVSARSQEDFLHECDVAASEFNLDPFLTEFIPCPAVSACENSTLPSRDNLVFKMADVLVPISCRLSGNMASRLAEAERTGREIEKKFTTGYSDRSGVIKYDPTIMKLNPDLDGLQGRYLIHWTRSVSSPWPKERRITFYRDVTGSERWPRSAFDTLMRIAKARTILASGRHMPGNSPTVCLSSLAPRQVLPLMRWRARYGEMSFEPYGIGIDGAVAEKIGIREVRYHATSQHASVPAEDRWRTQSLGKITDWTAEKEHRHLGDLSLNGIPSEALALFCMTTSEAEQLRGEVSCPAWALFNGKS